MFKNFTRKNILLKSVLFAYMLICAFNIFSVAQVNAMPFYDLRPKEIVLRAEFCTYYSSSTEERKHNIALASKALDGAFIDVGAEFSFNLTVGERTIKRGYKTSKIIVGGEFVDGVGGGVCQVSTTLYNALLLAGLKIIEYHPHSLPVSYVSPSFDAMVNSNSADLRFMNNTHNPLIIKTSADSQKILVQIYGEEATERYIRKSRITERIEPPEYQIFIDEKGEFPDLFEGESKVIKYGTEGYRSEGFIIVMKDGKQVGVKKIRSDKYAPSQGKIVIGTAVREAQESESD